MKHIESGNDDGPWNWYYKSYKEKHEKLSIINYSPLPIMWLIYPSFFVFMWLLVSLYIPLRLGFDSAFLKISDEAGKVISYRHEASIISYIALGCAIASAVIMIVIFILWLVNKFKED